MIVVRRDMSRRIFGTRASPPHVFDDWTDYDSERGQLFKERDPFRVSRAQVLLRPASGGLCANPELLQDREAALPDGRVRAALRGGARVLGPRLEPSRGVPVPMAVHELCATVCGCVRERATANSRNQSQTRNEHRATGLSSSPASAPVYFYIWGQ